VWAWAWAVDVYECVECMSVFVYSFHCRLCCRPSVVCAFLCVWVAPCVYMRGVCCLCGCIVRFVWLFVMSEAFLFVHVGRDLQHVVRGALSCRIIIKLTYSQALSSSLLPLARSLLVARRMDDLDELPGLIFVVQCGGHAPDAGSSELRPPSTHA
jgi:hypothetical protein